MIQCITGTNKKQKFSQTVYYESEILVWLTVYVVLMLILKTLIISLEHVFVVFFCKKIG